MTVYRAPRDFPPLVEAARTLSRGLGFGSSCSVETGSLLCLLTSHVQSGAVGEIGAGCGVGTAWMVSGLAATSHLVTVESESRRAAAVRELLSPVPRARVVHGDWHEIAAHGPFDLLFIDAGPAKKAPLALESGRRDADHILHSLRIGGLIVMDDFTPEDQWPEEWRGQPDLLRGYWLNEPRLRAIELLTTPTTAVILATRLS